MSYDLFREHLPAETRQPRLLITQKGNTMPMQQLACPNCGSTNLKGSLLVETNVVVTNTILSNPKSGIMKVKRGAHEYSDATGVALICARCHADSSINPLVTDINYDVVKK